MHQCGKKFLNTTFAQQILLHQVYLKKMPDICQIQITMKTKNEFIHECIKKPQSTFKNEWETSLETIFGRNELQTDKDVTDALHISLGSLISFKAVNKNGN